MQQESLSLEEFQEKFASEEACVEHLFRIRWPEDYGCPRCGDGRYYFHRTRHLYECKACRYQVSLTAGTIFAGWKVRVEFAEFWTAYGTVKREKIFDVQPHNIVIAVTKIKRNQ